MKIKLTDVAKAAGVSVSTVSRVINGDRERPASEATTNKIWQIVKDLGYVPNQNAKNLVKGSNQEEAHIGKIGCVYTSSFDLNNDPFFSCIGIGIQVEMDKQAYNLAFTFSIADKDYHDVYSYIVNNPVDGIIILGKIEPSIMTLLKEHYKHCVYAGVNGYDSDFDEVICDGYEGAKTAIEHLVSMGHTKIGYIGHVPHKTELLEKINEQRYKAYIDRMTGLHGFEVKEWVIHTNLRTTSAYETMIAYIETVQEMPTAFYCANDATAFGVMKALQNKGYKIPEDVAIIGFDNVEMARFVTPTLSSIQIPRRALGSRAVKMLIEQIEEQRDYPMKVSLPFELVVRESSDFRR